MRTKNAIIFFFYRNLDFNDVGGSKSKSPKIRSWHLRNYSTWSLQKRIPKIDLMSIILSYWPLEHLLGADQLIWYKKNNVAIVKNKVR